MNVIKSFNVKYNPNIKVLCKSKNLIKQRVKDEHPEAKERTNLEINEHINYEEIKKEKEELLKDASLKATEIIIAAKSEAKEIKDQAFADGHDKGYLRGYEDGFDKGYSEDHQELKNEMIALSKKQDNYNKIYNEHLLHAEQDILEIIMAITKKLTKDSYDANPEMINSLITEAINSCSNKEKLVVRVSPKNAKLVEDYKEEILGKIKDLDDFKIFEDDSITNYKCIIESPYGDISSGLRDQLQNIEENLQQMIKSYEYQNEIT